MKKSRVLALALTAAITVAGVGYAAWDDVLTINESVTMGNVDVDWTWNAIKEEPNHGVVTTNLPVAGNTNRSGEDNVYTVTLGNLYPGAVVNWTGQMTNMGSLPVKLTNFSIANLNDVQHLRDYLEVYYDTRLYDGANWSGYNTQTWIPFSQFEATMNADATLKGYIVPHNGRIQFGTEDFDAEPNAEPNCIKIRVKADAPESLMNANISFDLVFTLQQAY